MSMKKFSVFIFTSYIFIAITGQSHIHFPDSNAVWSEMKYSATPDGMSVIPTFYCYGLLNKDTIINGITYHKLYKSNDSVFTENEFIGGIREDSSNKIRYYGEVSRGFSPVAFSKDAILYDFNVKIGDTLTTNFKQHTNNDTLYPTDYFTLYGMQLIVKNVAFESINNSFRKVIYFTTPFHLKWTEGIGNARGLLWPNFDFPSNGTWNDMICLMQKDSIPYHNSFFTDATYSSCYYANDKISESSVNPKPSVIPNPVNDLSYIELNETENKFNTLEIFNEMGELVKKTIIVNLSRIPVNRNDFPLGIYFYRLADKNGFSVTGRFIVN